MNEAARIIEEGAATAEEIDKATRYGLGLRFAALGVVEFIDFGGADILHHASREMSGSIDAARYTAPPVIGKMPVVCGPTPGYIVPRLQALIMNEAARMIEEGAATAEEIDKATRHGLGLRFAALGVVEFIDFGGCDILHHASREMSASLDAGRYTAPAIVGRMVEQGRLGLKSGSGFYDYAGRDVAAYRRDVLSRTLGELRHAGLWRAPADETLP